LGEPAGDAHQRVAVFVARAGPVRAIVPRRLIVED
jgi:hypothetical protein